MKEKWNNSDEITSTWRKTTDKNLEVLRCLESSNSERIQNKDLARQLRMTTQAVAYHLRALRKLNLIEKQPDYQKTYYYISELGHKVLRKSRRRE